MNKWLKITIPLLSLVGVSAITAPFIVSCSNYQKGEYMKYYVVFNKNKITTIDGNKVFNVYKANFDKPLSIDEAIEILKKDKQNIDNSSDYWYWEDLHTISNGETVKWDNISYYAIDYNILFNV